MKICSRHRKKASSRLECSGVRCNKAASGSVNQGATYVATTAAAQLQCVCVCAGWEPIMLGKIYSDGGGQPGEEEGGGGEGWPGHLNQDGQAGQRPSLICIVCCRQDGHLSAAWPGGCPPVSWSFTPAPLPCSPLLDTLPPSPAELRIEPDSGGRHGQINDPIGLIGSPMPMRCVKLRPQLKDSDARCTLMFTNYFDRYS